MKFDIDYIADLARLRLTSAEKKRLAPQLKSLLAYVEKISELDTDGISPTYQTTGLEDVVRKDEVDRGRSLSQKEALSNAPDKKDGSFKVKRVLNRNGST